MGLPFSLFRIVPASYAKSSLGFIGVINHSNQLSSFLKKNDEGPSDLSTLAVETYYTCACQLTMGQLAVKISSLRGFISKFPFQCNTDNQFFYDPKLISIFFNTFIRQFKAGQPCHWTKRNWWNTVQFRDGRINLDVIAWIKFKNISPWISAITTYEQITHKLWNRIIKYLIPIMELKYTSKLGSGKILNVLHSVLVSVR